MAQCQRLRQRRLTRCLLCIATTSLVRMTGEGRSGPQTTMCLKQRMLKPFSNQTIDTIGQYNRFSYIYGMLYCSSECGSIPIMQLRTIYCNAHVHTFHVCLCLLALTFVCNSTYLLKCSFQIYQKSIVYIVFITSSKV